MSLESTCSNITTLISNYSDNKIDEITDISNNHRDNMYVNEDILNDKIILEKNLINCINVNKHNNEIFNIQIEEANNMINTLILKNEMLPKQINIINNNIDNKSNINNLKLKELNLLKSSLSYRTNEFNKSFDLYRKYLGLDFVVLDNKLYFQFTKLDSLYPNKVFTFAVYVNENELYQVENCEPMIENLSTLVDVLNNTNDFSKFVRLMRKEFVKMTNQIEGVAKA